MNARAALYAMYAAFDFGAHGEIEHALARARARPRASPAARRSPPRRARSRSARGSASPMSSVAMRIMRRADVERIGAAVEHAAHPVERRVGIASRAPPCAAPRSGRRTPRRPCRSGAGCARSSPRRTRGRSASRAGLAGGDRELLDEVDEAAAVAVGVGDQRVARRRVERRCRGDAARQRAVEQLRRGRPPTAAPARRPPRATAARRSPRTTDSRWSRR